MTSGVRWYVGIPRSGKTTLALSHAAQLAAETGRPLLAIEAERDAQFERWPRAERARDLPELLWGPSRRAAIEPIEDDLPALWRLLRDPGGLVVVLDGAHAFLSARSWSSDRLIAAMRTHAHANLWLLLTTHHLSGDIPQAAIACAPEVYLFRTAGRSLKVIESEWNVSRDRLATLEKGEFLRLSVGFVD